MRLYDRDSIKTLPEFAKLPEEHRAALRVVSAVLPFRVNNYVIQELIDWDNIPDDPIFRLLFPQQEMLCADDYRTIQELIESDASAETIRQATRRIQLSLNPHPAGQIELNVPTLTGKKLAGMQHKYPETVLFFPTAGQTCFSYCSYCFRWPQFVGLDQLKFASSEAGVLVDYLRKHTEVTSVLITGGDPMIMRATLLKAYIEPLLSSGLDHIDSIRIGTKSLAFWPQRYVSDDDAAEILRLFEQVSKAGKTLAFMAHYSHPRFMQTDVAKQAIANVRDTGAVIRCQSPLVRHVNDDPAIWVDMWNEEVRLGMVPYYMFVLRDTGARQYFELPLAQCYEIFSKAYSHVSGLARTVRGPSMSCTPGKVIIDSIVQIGSRKAFALKFLQGRNPEWVNRLFLAKFDPKAAWMDQLQPFTREKKTFFFEEELTMMKLSQLTA